MFVLNADELISKNCKDLPVYHYLSCNERYAESCRKSALFLKLVREHNLDDDTVFFAKL